MNTEKKRKNHRTRAEAERSGMKRATVSKGIQYDTVTKKYIVTLANKAEDGTLLRESKTYATFAEAEQARAEHIADKNAKLPQNMRRTLTLAQCIDEFIQASVREKRLERTTESGYRVIYHRVEHAPIGRKKIISLLSDDICTHLETLLREKNLKPTTVNKDLDLIRGALNYAIVKRYLSTNPAASIRPYRESPADIKPLTVEQVERLHMILEKYGNATLKTVIFLGMYQGLRRGEIVGLKWSNIDFAANYLYIKETRTQVGGELITKQPKTEDSARDIYMFSAVSEALAALKREQEESGTLGEYVIMSPTGARYNPTNLSAAVTRFMKKIGLHDTGLHTLRHTYATIAINHGAPIVEVSKALGHSNTHTTLRIYTHGGQTASKIVGEKMEDIFRRSKAPEKQARV